MNEPARARARRRVSRRRYLVRRAALVAAVVVGGFGVVRVAGALGDDGDDTAETADTADLADTADAVSTTERTDAPTTTRAETTAPPVTVPETTAPPETTVPATEPPSTGPPTADDPADVLVVGDSFAGLWGPPLSALLDETGIVRTEIDYKMSTGLARPTKLDWFARLRQRLPDLDPDIVISSFGGNDFVGLLDDDGSVLVGDPLANQQEWLAAYQHRAGEMMDLLAEDGRTVIWVGTANHPDPATSIGLALQDQAAKAAAGERADVVFIDTWDVLAGRDGGWAAYVIDPRDGKGKAVRMADGFHPNETGCAILATEIADAVRAALIARGATL